MNQDTHFIQLFSDTVCCLKIFLLPGRIPFNHERRHLGRIRYLSAEIKNIEHNIHVFETFKQALCPPGSYLTINDKPVDALHTGQKTGYQNRDLEIVV